MLFRLYIGSNNETGELESAKAISIIGTRFQGFTTSQADGYWQGKPEKSLVVEIESDSQEDIENTAKVLAIELKQQAIGVAKIGKMQFIS
jgi:thiamine pyrophosphate-dependent acetolactate synthase large subunit-like protein